MSVERIVFVTQKAQHDMQGKGERDRKQNDPAPGENIKARRHHQNQHRAHGHESETDRGLQRHGDENQQRQKQGHDAERRVPVCLAEGVEPLLVVH